jgi:DNA-binding PadR family transcriptional regulator
VQQEVVLAMLAKEPSHGYQLRARLGEALGPLGDAMNAGQVYVALSRLEKAGLVTGEHSPGLPDRPDRKVYALTPDGQQRVAGWLAEVSWPRPDLAEFHLKLVAAAAAKLADPLGISQPAQQLAALPIDDGKRVSQAGLRGRDQLQMEFRQIGPGPAHLREPVGDPLLTGRGQLVHLAVGPVREPGRMLGGDQARLLQPREGHVDLPRVQGVPERAERLPEARSQLVAVRRLLGQQRQHHFLLHA